MKVTSARIKNFRTITVEQVINVREGCTLIGPNNSGKTNAMLGVYYFFTGYDNKYGYDDERDIPFSHESVKTSITLVFEADPQKDKDVLDRIGKLKQMLKSPRTEVSGNSFSINVYFNGQLPVYQIYPGAKKADGKSAQYSTLQKSIVTMVLDAFQCYYIPSNKSIAQLYDEFVSPFVKKKVAEALEPYDEEIRKSIQSLTDCMNSALASSGLEDVKTALEYPRNALEHLISGFELMVQDNSRSSIFTKGMGIQSAVLLSSFKWITQQKPEKRVLWLIEEPETYMHPSLAYQSSKILEDLASISTVIKTTHSLSFMPQSVDSVQGVATSSTAGTRLQSYSTMRDATEDIRSSLGVKFSDYFGLTDLNIFVEGETDIEYLSQMALYYQEAYDENLIIASSDIQYRDFGGVKELEGFIRANYMHVRKEVVVISVFDGDEAGRKSIKDLHGFYGNKGGFNGNFDYVVVPGKIAIEALFPDGWILSAHKLHPSWFEYLIPDAAGGVTDFKLSGTSKKAFKNFALELCVHATDYEFLEKFEPLIKTLEACLKSRIEKLWPHSSYLEGALG
ncbi:ATP-dependent nuclease [Pseudomonas fluorescens]|uniref:ATP-dependent nuclease n=1 Tax=Pseudomonas fluorescens TaxID=294 RepID=UPI000641D457|nr:AAA family ATPase [Pseudomonas fluorescens]